MGRVALPGRFGPRPLRVAPRWRTDEPTATAAGSGRSPSRERVPVPWPRALHRPPHRQRPGRAASRPLLLLTRPSLGLGSDRSLGGAPQTYRRGPHEGGPLASSRAEELRRAHRGGGLPEGQARRHLRRRRVRRRLEVRQRRPLLAPRVRQRVHLRGGRRDRGSQRRRRRLGRHRRGSPRRDVLRRHRRLPLRGWRRDLAQHGARGQRADRQGAGAPLRFEPDPRGRDRPPRRRPRGTRRSREPRRRRVLGADSPRWPARGDHRPRPRPVRPGPALGRGVGPAAPGRGRRLPEHRRRRLLDAPRGWPAAGQGRGPCRRGRLRQRARRGVRADGGPLPPRQRPL